MTQMNEPVDLRDKIKDYLLRGPVLASIGALLVTMAVVLANMSTQRLVSFDDFEVGKVADRDVIAERAISYEDGTATRLRQDAFERQTPPVFVYSEEATQEILERWVLFVELAESLIEENVSRESFVEGINEVFPYLVDNSILRELYSLSSHDNILSQSTFIINEILIKGIYSVPSSGLERLNQEVVELLRGSVSSGYVSERIPIDEIIKIPIDGDVLDRYIATGSFSQVPANFAKLLVKSYLTENIFFSAEDTAKRIVENRRKAEPALKYIEKDKKIIRKGFIVTEDNMVELRAFMASRPSLDGRTIASHIILMLLLFGVLFYYCAQEMGRKLSHSESYMVSILAAGYLIGTVLLRSVSFGSDSAYVSLIMPTALVVMLPAILISMRLSVILALMLPMGAFFIGSYDVSSFIFAVMSGMAAVFALRKAAKRMDLVKAGMIAAGANCIAMIAGLLGRHASIEVYPAMLFWAAFNGLASGMLVLGFLPPLEQLLNTATSFRLIELSDLNAPILKKLFTAAPGTYSHSIMVANLAEAACQDIKANALLARVGAYYHDLGKMDNPDYFVENQTNYNRHDDMEPRTSVAVIRSHVTLGLDKGRQLRLPARVLEIIGEHHGNSVITWFYSKALQQEGEVSIEDFSYPGNPPRSKESVVVSLADMVEAAVRTLDKPTSAKLEEFVKELFNSKLEHGQLSRAELTFAELEITKNAFIRVLNGYYHSRIEYPKLPS